jgi:hypothetical protein
MIKAVFGSLLCGAATLFVATYLYFLISLPGTTESVRELVVTPEEVKVGSALHSAGGQFILDAQGRGELLWSGVHFPARNYPLLDLSFTEVSAGAKLTVFWQRVATGNQRYREKLPESADSGSPHSLARSRDWQGTISDFGVLIEGTPESTVAVNTVRLLPATPLNQIRGILAKWAAVESWDHRAINRNLATVKMQNSVTLYPAPVVVLWLGFGFVFYMLLIRLSPRYQFDWRVPAGIFLVGWLSLDLLWQGELYGRLKETRTIYASLEPGEKRFAGGDAMLYRFVTQAMAKLAPEDERVFVSSKSDYVGMRSAYFVLPKNVFWRRGGPELPPRRFLHKGDHILVIPPTDLKIDLQRRVLITPDDGQLEAERVYLDAVGGLFKVL